MSLDDLRQPEGRTTCGRPAGWTTYGSRKAGLPMTARRAGWSLAFFGPKKKVGSGRFTVEKKKNWLSFWLACGVGSYAALRIVLRTSLRSSSMRSLKEGRFGVFDRHLGRCANCSPLSSPNALVAAISSME